MGATLSAQQDSKCEEEDEEQHPGQEEDSEEDKLLKKNGHFSSQSGKSENLTNETNSQSEGQDLLDVGSGFVTLKEDPSDTTSSSQEDVSQTSTSNISKQMNNTDDMVAKEENEASNKQNDTEIGFKKIFRFGGLKFTLKKDKAEKIDASQPIKTEEDMNAASPSEDSWDTIDVNAVSANEQDEDLMMNERMGGDAHSESPETCDKSATDNMSAPIKHQEEASPDKEQMKDVPKTPEPEEPMSPIKRFFSQGLWSSLKKKSKEEERPTENGEELKSLDKLVEKEAAKDDTTCTCLDVSSSTFDQDKDIQLYKKDECKPTVDGDAINSVEQDKVQASPFKRLFRKLSTRRQSDTKPADANVTDPGRNSSETPQLSTEFVKSLKEQETPVVVTQPSGETMDTSHEESKKKSDSSVSWENLICVRSGKTRARKPSDTDDDAQDKGGMLKRTSESPVESSSEPDHLTSSNEQGGSPAEEDSGSTWKSFKKLVTPRKKSRTEESGSLEQMQSDSEITKDESSCSLRKLISGRKKMKADGQQETVSSDEGSKGTGTDLEDDETPGVVPLSEYEIVEPENLNVITDGKTESKNDMQLVKEEDAPKQMQPLYNEKPLSFDTGASGTPIPKENMEELTEFLSKYQQLSDIPEEGFIEESVATPLSFVEWTTQDDTIDDDIVDMTADAVTAPEPATERNEDESTEMVSAVSQLSESPKTSGNITPVSPVYGRRESDMILQEVMESISMVPSALAITTNDNVPEALAVSVSQFIAESTTETKVLVAHKKEETTSVCIGIVSQEIRAAEVVLPLPIVEGMSEIARAIPTEIVSAEFGEEPEAAETSSNNVFNAEIKEIRSMFHEAVLNAAESTVLAETERTSKQTFIMLQNIEEDAPVIQMEDVEEQSIEYSNGICGFAPVQSAVQGGTLEEQITALDINRPESEGPLQSALEEPVYEYLIENTKTSVEAEKIDRIPDVESSTADAEQQSLAPLVTHNVESVPDSSLTGSSKIIEDVVQVSEAVKPVMYSVAASESNTEKNQASEIIEEMTEVPVSDVKWTPISNVIPMSESIKTEMELKNEVQMENDLRRQNARTELALGNTLDSADAFEVVEKIVDEGKTTIEHTPAETTEDIAKEKIALSLKAANLSEIIDKPTKEKEEELNTFVTESTVPVIIINEETAVKEPKETVLGEEFERKQTTGDEIYTPKNAETEEEIKEQSGISEHPTVCEEVAEDGIQQTTTHNLEPLSYPTLSRLIACAQTTALSSGISQEDSAKSEATGDSDKLIDNEPEQTANIHFEIPTKAVALEAITLPGYVEHQLEPQTGILEPIDETNQAAETTDTIAETPSAAALKHDDGGVSYNIPDQPSTLLQCLKQSDSGNSLEQVKEPDTGAKPSVNVGIITEQQGAVETFLEVNTEESQKQVLSSKQEESQATESGQESYKEIQVTSTAEITANISSVIYEEGTELESTVSGQPVETGPSFKDMDVNMAENVTEIPPKDKSKPHDGFVQTETKGSEPVMEVVKTTSPISFGVESDSEVELTVGPEQTFVSTNVAEQVVSEIGIANFVGKSTELIAASNLKDEPTTMISEGPTVVTYETVTESLVSENEPEMLKQLELTSEILQVTESKADIIVVSETHVGEETCVVDSLVSELEVETEMATLVEEIHTQVLALTSEIHKFQADLISLNTPDVSTATTLQESPVVSEIRTETSLASLIASPLPIMEVAEKGDLHINRPVTVEVTEPKVEMLMLSEALSHTSAVSALDQQTMTTEQITKAAALTSVMESMESTCSNAEEPITATCMKQLIASVAAVVQTPIIIATEVQRLPVVPFTAVETQADNSAVNNADIQVPRIEIKERHCDAQVTVKAAQPLHTEGEEKVTKQLIQDVQSTANPKKDCKRTEERTENFATVETAESLAGPDDDVWEDAVDDISDDQSSCTELSVGRQDITMHIH